MTDAKTFDGTGKHTRLRGTYGWRQTSVAVAVAVVPLRGKIGRPGEAKVYKGS